MAECALNPCESSSRLQARAKDAITHSIDPLPHMRVWANGVSLREIHWVFLVMIYRPLPHHHHQAHPPHTRQTRGNLGRVSKAWACYAHGLQGIQVKATANVKATSTAIAPAKANVKAKAKVKVTATGTGTERGGRRGRGWGALFVRCLWFLGGLKFGRL